MPSELLDELLVRIGLEALPERLKALSYLAAGSAAAALRFLKPWDASGSSLSNSWAMAASCKRCEHRRSAAGCRSPPVVTSGIYYPDVTESPPEDGPLHCVVRFPCSMGKRVSI
jgi:hypothetical protein